MQSWLTWIAALLSLAYGGLTAFAGLGQVRQQRIQAWAAWGMAFSGLVVAAIAVLLWLGSAAALPVLVAGLIAIHVLAVNNGLKMYGRINPGHHLVRLLVSLILIALTYLAGS
jgi:hypothetical protein